MSHPPSGRDSAPLCASGLPLLPSLEKLRWRPDLQVAILPGRYSSRVVVKDPVALRYFQLKDYEYELLRQVGQRRSFEDLVKWFERSFPPLRMSLWQLQEFLHRSRRDGLLTSTGDLDGAALRHSGEASRSAWSGILLQPWAIRLPGIHPGWILDFLAPVCGILFSPACVTAAGVLLSILFLIVAGNASEIFRLLPDPQSFLHAGNVVLLTGCIAASKMFHELGHAVAARRNGVECHEMGVLLLAGLPTLYCDVSDAWMLPSRWSRIQISLGGIWFDLLTGGLAAATWLSTAPGVLNSVALNLAVVCSVSTLAFNLNPLLRYDGYYVLMDLTETPNLGQTAGQALRRWWDRWGLGLPAGLDPSWSPARSWHAWYGLASLGYRCWLIPAILLFVHAAFRPFGLSSFVWLAAMFAGGAGAVRTLRSNAAAVRRLRRFGVPAWRLAAGYAGLLALLIAVLMAPCSRFVVIEGVVEPADTSSVCAVVPGKLVHCLPPGHRVAAGETVARLENPDLQLSLAQVQSELRGARRRLELIEARRNEDPAVAEQIPVAAQEISSLKNREDVLRSELQLLDLKSPLAGFVVPAVARASNVNPRGLPLWSGQLQDPRNLLAWVAPGDIVCCVGVEGRHAVTAYLSESRVGRLSEGQSAQVMLESTAERIYRGRIRRISRVDLDAEQESTVLLQDVRWIVDEAGRRRLAETYYLVRLDFEEPLPPDTLPRSRAQVRIETTAQRVWEWLAEEFFRTLRWRLS